MENHIKRAIAVKAENPMEHVKNWGTGCGLIGGLGNYLLQTSVSGGLKIIETLLIAFLCGLAGAAGKWAFDYARKKITKSKL